jgi:hypothetical protein
MTQQPNPQPERVKLSRIINCWINNENARIGPKRILVGNDFDVLADSILAHYVSKDAVREAVKTIEAANDSNDRYNACQELRRALGLDKPERTE